MGACILVFGVSGVGKTTACLDYAGRHPDVQFISASTLLKEAKAATSEELRTAGRKQIIDNQSLLPIAFERYRRERKDQTILLDAHAVIDNDRTLVAVPSSVISALQPSRLILLEAPPIEIAARRSGDKRQRPLRDLDAIAYEINAERAAVAAYGEELGLSVTVATVGQDFQLDDVLGR